LDENKIDNSYTQYENRIGLTSKGKFLKDSNDVVLDFPYKDCILEGGQSTEEGTDTYFEWDEKDQHYTEKQAKRKEIFFNSVLAKDEIDRLLEPKAFTNAKKYSIHGEKSLSTFERDVNGTIKDNLIIKGNNLLALHTLKKEFAGKVKLIYIDPPYNTGSDSFAYNDNFNHSTWLTFMRNRLMVAKELLSDCGLIFVHCDDNEQAYLKILNDDIFGRENFVNTIVMKTINPNGIKTTHAKKTILKVKEMILVYKKHNILLKPQYKVIDKYDKFYDLFIEGDLNNLNDCKVIKLKDKIKTLGYEFDLKDSNFKEFILANSDKIFQTKFDKRVQNDQRYEDGGLYIYDDNNNYYVYQKRFGLKLSKVIKQVFEKDEIAILLGDVWDDFKLNNLYLEGEVDFSNAKKPEQLLYRIIDMVTNKNDIVLDFQLGSGTTSAVAHKMNRQFIGIEQMNYIEIVAVERLKKVIDGEQGGISKSVNWQGGGSFVYLELAKNNQNAIEIIQGCKNYEELTSFFDEMCEKYFLHYNVKVKQFREEISKEANFKKLSLDNQKELFIKMLDLNQLYVNVSDMEDQKYNLRAADIAVTKDFYQL
jgi:adenine-specific DNA-methyltransferase